jgi:tetratricopeptide (TPR) repeat protein
MRAYVLNCAGRPEAALKMVEQAMRLNPRFPPIYVFQLGWAYYGTGRYTEAVATLTELFSRSPNFPYAHLLLAAVYSELGKKAEARAEAAEVLRISPQWSLEVYKERIPIKDPAVLERFLTALRKAGLK